jgi:hypothetical protein
MQPMTPTPVKSTNTASMSDLRVPFDPHQFFAAGSRPVTTASENRKTLVSSGKGFPLRLNHSGGLSAVLPMATNTTA